MGFDRPRVVAAVQVSVDRAGALAAFRAAARAAAPHLLGAPAEGCEGEELLRWLRGQGVGEEALEALSCAGLTAELFAGAKDEDWHDEELGLPEQDIALLQRLQKAFRP